MVTFQMQKIKKSLKQRKFTEKYIESGMNSFFPDLIFYRFCANLIR